MMMAKSISLVTIYPHSLIYIDTVLKSFAKNNLKINLFVRSKINYVGKDKFEIIGNKVFKNNNDVYYKLPKNVEVFITPRHNLGIIYFLKYFTRLLKTYIFRHHIGNSTTFKNRDRKLLDFLKYFIPFFRLLPKSFLIKFFNNIEDFLPSQKIYEDLIQNDSLVFVSPCNWNNRRFYLCPEIEFLKSANKLGIKSIVYQFSLDNFRTREILHFDVGYVLGWYEGCAKGFLDESQRKNSKYMDLGSSYMEYRLDKFKKMKRNENKKKRNQIFYAGSSSNVVNADIEYQFVEKLKIKLKQKGINVLYRPHPNNLPSGIEDVSFESDSTLVFKQISNCDCLIGISNTLMYESALLSFKVCGINFFDYDLMKDSLMKSFLKDNNIFSNEDDLLAFLLNGVYGENGINIPHFEVEFNNFLSREKII